MNSCFICKNKQLFTVCLGCYQGLLDKRYLGCARCGSNSCSYCSSLISFSSVTSLFSFQGEMANLVNSAKNRKELWAQMLFTALFKTIFTSEVRKFSADLIVYAPVRVRRLQTSPWHPIFEMQHWINKTDSQIPKLCGYLVENTRQSSRSSEERFFEMKNDTVKKPIFYSWEETKQLQEKKTKKILLIDDVLTTGQSVSAVRKKCQEEFALPEDSQWHLFTLFRTPQAKKVLV